MNLKARWVYTFYRKQLPYISHPEGKDTACHELTIGKYPAEECFTAFRITSSKVNYTTSFAGDEFKPTKPQKKGTT